MFSKILTGRVRRVGIAALFAASCMVTTASAQVTAFKQAIAEAASKDLDIAAFYQANGYQALWTTANAARRNALLTAISDADLHGLPVIGRGHWCFSPKAKYHFKPSPIGARGDPPIFV